MNNEVNPSSPGVVTAHGLCRVRLGLWLSSLCLKWEDENTAEAQDLPPRDSFLDTCVTWWVPDPALGSENTLGGFRTETSVKRSG